MILSEYIDHTLLSPTATIDDIKTLCKEAILHNFYAICVNGSHVKLAKQELRNSNIRIAAVVGFPLGASTVATKVFEAKEAINNGADEIDMVINIGLLKSNDFDAITEEIKIIKSSIGNNILKVIFENCYLNNNDIKKACKASIIGKADFIKTSTGFGTNGATKEDVILMKKEVGEAIKIKASGGIKDHKTALEYINLGISRIGTSSGIKIITNN